MVPQSSKKWPLQTANEPNDLALYITSEFLKVHLVLRLSYEMEPATWVQIVDKAVCISIDANALGKSLNPSLFSTPAMIE